MLALLITLFIAGIIAAVIAIALVPFVNSYEETDKPVLLVVIIYVGGILLANACFWGSIIFFIIKILKNILQ